MDVCTQHVQGTDMGSGGPVHLPLTKSNSKKWRLVGSHFGIEGDGSVFAVRGPDSWNNPESGPAPETCHARNRGNFS